jgi:adenosylcobinamide-GDP ribazoletransferase
MGVAIETTGAAARRRGSGRVVDEVRAAVAGLTRLPVGTRSIETSGVAAFGLVGAIVGLAGLVPLVLLGGIAPVVAAILAVAGMAVVSGGLHLDGLADTADALMATSLEAAEQARKDPAVGVGGVTALILVLGLQVAALAQLAAAHGPIVAGIACVVAGAGSRALAPALALLARSRVAPDGIGRRFADGLTARGAAIAILTAIAVGFAGSLLAGSAFAGSITVGVSLAVGGLVGAILGLALGLGLVRLRRQMDGDVLGATVEISAAAILAAVAVGARWPVP